jgi:hypothetical protein
LGRNKRCRCSRQRRLLPWFSVMMRGKAVLASTMTRSERVIRIEICPNPVGLA